MSELLLLTLYVVLALGFSFLCSIAEAVLLSITPAFIEGVREESPARADMLMRLRQTNVDQSLAAILTLNTIAHTVGAVGAGAEAAKVFGSAWLGLFSAVMTLLVLFLSEIIPKTIGAVYWRRLAMPTELFVSLLIKVLYPLIWIMERLTRMIGSGKPLHIFNRDEFIALADVGERSGSLQEHESRIFRNLFKFGSLCVMDIMTPRTVIAALREDLTVTEAADNIGRAHSRYPVYLNGIDDARSFVLKEDIFTLKLKGEGDTKLEAIKRPLPAVPATMPLALLLDSLLDQRQHIAMVVDEYGGTAGLVTLEDLVETLLGMEIVDERDEVGDMRALARRQWEKRKKALGVDAEPPTVSDAPKSEDGAQTAPVDKPDVAPDSDGRAEQP